MKWSENELKFLYDNYKNKTSKEISISLNRSKNSIDAKIIRLGLDRSNIWSKEEIEYLEKNYNILDINIISDKLNKTKQSIINKASILSLKSKKTWEDYEIEILKNNYGIKEINEYKSLLKNRSINSISHKAKTLSLTSNKRFRNKYKYEINHNYFSQIDKFNSYWAGFIAADGHIKKDSSCLSIKLSSLDIEHLNQFKKDIETNSPIFIKKGKSFDKDVEFCEINLYSRFIVKDIYRNFKIENNKTFSITFPNFNNDMDSKLSFICGLIDGDGSISITGNKISITILGTFDILENVKSIMGSIIDVSNINITKKSKIYSFCITSSINDNESRIKKLYSKIKELNIPLLERKWTKIYG